MHSIHTTHWKYCRLVENKGEDKVKFAQIQFQHSYCAEPEIQGFKKISQNYSNAAFVKYWQNDRMTFHMLVRQVDFSLLYRKLTLVS